MTGDGRRGLSTIQGATITVGALLGTGVISLPGIAAGDAGPASLAAWAALLVISIPLAATFAALGSRFPGGGGVTSYARRALGDYAATGLGWAMIAATGAAAPVGAGFAGSYIADAVGGGRPVALGSTAAIMLVVVAMNWFGIHISARLQLAIMSGIALALVVAIAVALPHARAANLTPFAPHGAGGVVTAVGALVWAFGGWEVMASISGEYRDPARSIARATAIALVVVALLYLGVAFVTVAVLGSAPGAAPLSSLLAVGFGPLAHPVMAVVATLLTIGTMNSYYAGTARLAAALAAAGSAPRFLDQRGEPRRALLMITVLAFVSLGAMSVLHLDAETILMFMSATIAAAYLVSTAAALRLLPRRGWGRGVAWAGLATSLALLAATGWAILAPILAIGVGCLWLGFARTRAGRAAAMRP